MDTLRHSWAFDRPPSSPFARPSGLIGRIAGVMMLWTNRREQQEVLHLLDVRPGERVLEVGYGPGGLVRLLTDRTQASFVQGVDPSETMREVAARRNREAVRAGRVELGLGTADDTGLPDRSVDVVVSVNTVAFWPDLEAGVEELHRVLRPGGTLALAWHGGRRPAPLTRALRLPEDRLAHLHQVLARTFPEVTRHRLNTLDVFRALR